MLREWQAGVEVRTARLVGRVGRPIDINQFTSVFRDDPELLILDDFQWMTDECADAIISRANDVAIWGARRPFPNSGPVSVLGEILSEVGQPTRLGLLDLEGSGVRLAKLLERPANNSLVEVAHTWTGGSPALLRDLVDLGDLALLGEDDAPMAPDLVEQVVARVRQLGPEGHGLARLLAFDPELTMDDAAGALDPSLVAADAERSLRASGLLDSEGRLVRLVAMCVATDFTADDRQALRGDVIQSLAATDAVAAARHLAGSEASNPTLILEAARQLCDVEPAEAQSLLGTLKKATLEPQDQRLLALLTLRLGLDEFNDVVERGIAEAAEYFDDLALIRELRSLRWPLAAQRNPTTLAGEQLHQLASMLVGQDAAPPTDDGSLIGGIIDAIGLVGQGNAAQGFSRLAGLADNFVSSDRVETGLGLTPHLLGALVGLLVGDQQGAATLLDEAVDQRVGGRAEHDAAVAVSAFARMRMGDYATAVELVKAEGEPRDFRLRLVRAALNAGLARRSGDTTRMRHAWLEADAVLARPTASWLLSDLLGELLLVGAKLGDDRRVDEVVAELEQQVATQPAATPGAVSVTWLRFQLAVQRADRGQASAEATNLAGLAPDDRRSAARVQAAPLWVLAMDGEADVDELIAVATELGDCGDSWEGSRLLGQGALDHPDSTAARRLLEAARGLSVDLADVETGDGLMALGLSEREAEVAQLVVNGKTYKEIGAQLFISPKTVEHHVARSRQKLGATSRAEFLAAVAAAVQ